MGRITIAVYRPKKGKEDALLKLVHEHMPILKSQQLITERKPIVMQAADKSIIEIFEWTSVEAIKQAHTNAAVQDLWNRFSEVCAYDMPVNVTEFHNMFSEFEPIN
jgi:quinol monooxygenase YgiN